MNHRSLRASPRGLDGLVVPLQHPLGVGEAAVLLGVRGGGQEEHLGADVLGAQLAGLDLRAVLPPGRALDQREVAHHQPVEVGHAQALHLGVGRADGRVLADQEVALAVARDLGHHGLVGAVAAGQPRQVVEAEVVVGGRRVAPPRLEQAHQVGAQVAPEALVRPSRPRRRRRGPRATAACGIGDVAGQQVEQRRDVGGALDAGVPAQRQDAAAGPADVAQQQSAGSTRSRMYCTPTVCWVQPTAVGERGGALAARSSPSSSSQTRRNSSCGTPQICSTISGV